MKVAVLTVGTPDVVRAGLESILKSRRGVSVCARPGGGRKKDIIALLRTAKPDVTVVVVPALGTEAAVQAQALTALARKSSRVLVLLPGCDALGMRKVREAGAGGCVSLACSTDELFEALSSVNAGGRLPAGDRVGR